MTPPRQEQAFKQLQEDKLTVTEKLKLVQNYLLKVEVMQQKHPHKLELLVWLLTTKWGSKLVRLIHSKKIAMSFPGHTL